MHEMTREWLAGMQSRRAAWRAVGVGEYQLYDATGRVLATVKETGHSATLICRGSFTMYTEADLAKRAAERMCNVTTEAQR